jgi:hypothetical protein
MGVRTADQVRYSMRTSSDFSGGEYPHVSVAVGAMGNHHPNRDLCFYFLICINEGGLRVGEEVAPLTPHRSGRAQLRHPVPQRADSLTVWRSDEQSEAAVTEIG